MSAVVRVRGSATATARPDRARLMFELQYLAPSAELALADVTPRAARLEDLCEEFGFPLTDRHTTGVSVAEQREWDGTRFVQRGYSASTRLVLRVQDAALIGRLITDAVARTNATVHGPNWEVDTGNPARLTAYRGAALDARRRAEAYAGALGMRILGVVEISELGTSAGLTMSTLAMGGIRPLSASSDLSGKLSVEPGEIDVSATVDVIFSAE